MMDSFDNSMAGGVEDVKSGGIGALSSAGEESGQDAQQSRSIPKKAAFLLVALLLLSLLAFLPSVRHAVVDNQLRLKEFIWECGPWAPVVFTFGVAVLVGIGFPRLAFHFLGGALFAFWQGLLWSVLGTVIGYSVVFFAVRRLGLREVILRKHPKWLKLTAKLKHNSVPAVILFRQVPLPGWVTNAVLGLSPIRRREFFLGTCIGLLPEGVPTVLLGTGLRKEDLGQAGLYLFVAITLFIAVWILWGGYTRRAAAEEADGKIGNEPAN